MVKPNDIVRMTFKHKSGLVEESARVTWIEEGEERIYFGYVPSDLPDSVRCGFGAATVYRVFTRDARSDELRSKDKKPFGLQKIEIIGRAEIRPYKPFPSLFQNPGI